MATKYRAEKVIRLVNEMAVLAGEDQLQVIRLALEKRKRRMIRAPYACKLLTSDEIEELLSYGPTP